MTKAEKYMAKADKYLADNWETFSSSSTKMTKVEVTLKKEKDDHVKYLKAYERLEKL